MLQHILKKVFWTDIFMLTRQADVWIVCACVISQIIAPMNGISSLCFCSSWCHIGVCLSWFFEDLNIAIYGCRCHSHRLFHLPWTTFPIIHPSTHLHSICNHWSSPAVTHHPHLSKGPHTLHSRSGLIYGEHNVNGKHNFCGSFTC